MYQIKRVNLGKTPQLDRLAHACGELYSQTLVFFWRTVRKKGIWLKPKHLMRLFTSDQLHAHTSDACVQAFFASLKPHDLRHNVSTALIAAGTPMKTVQALLGHTKIATTMDLYGHVMYPRIECGGL